MVTKSAPAAKTAKQRQVGLVEALDLAQALIRSAGTGIYIVQEGEFVYASPLFQELTGYTEEELIGRRSLELVHPEDREALRKKAIESLKSHSLLPYEYRFIKKNGDIVWILERVTSADYRGTRAAIASFMDITDRKRVEEALRQSEERYRTILEEMHDGYFETDLAGNLTFFNDWECGHMGYSRDEMMGMNYRVYTAKEYVEPVYEAFNSVYRTGEPIRNISLEVVRNDGSTRFGETSAFPLRNQEGDIVGFRGIHRDITERKQAEEQLLMAETAIRTSVSAIASIDLNGKLTYVNPAFLRIWGYDSPDEVLGRSLASLCEEEKVQELVQALLTGTGTLGAEVTAKKKNGTEFIVGLRASLIVDAQGQPVGMTSSLADITERKRMEQEKRELDRMKSEFVSSVSHELRTPLHSIQGFTQLMLEGKATNPETQKKFLTIIDKQSARLGKLINNLLDVSHLESGRFSIQKQPLSIKKTIHEAIEGLRSLAVQNGMTINADTPATLPEVKGDEERLMQVIVNLINNAIKFSPDGGGVAVKAEAKDAELLVHVTDHGIGIPEQAMPHLFQRFFRAKDSASIGGTGLGLYISKEIVEAHGGRMWAESKVGEGSTFGFSLPLNQDGGDFHEEEGFGH